MEERPNALTPEVVFSAATAILAQVRKHLAEPVIADDVAIMQLAGAITASTDAYERAVHLSKHGTWVVDEALVQALSLKTGIESRAIDEEVQRWVVRTGIRFPATLGDKITFRDPQGKTRVGTVLGTDQRMAQGVVGVGVANAPLLIMKADAEKVWMRYDPEGNPAVLEAIRRNVGFTVAA